MLRPISRTSEGPTCGAAPASVRSVACPDAASETARGSELPSSELANLQFPPVDRPTGRAVGPAPVLQRDRSLCELRVPRIHRRGAMEDPDQPRDCEMISIVFHLPPTCGGGSTRATFTIAPVP